MGMTRNTDTDTRTDSPTPTETPYRDADWLREQYVEKQRSQKEIADECDVAPPTIRKWLTTHEIPRQKRGEETYQDESWMDEQYVKQEKTQHEIADECDVIPETIRNWLGKYDIEIQAPRGKPGEDTYRNADWLREQYVEQHRPQYEIGDECDVNQSTIGYWLDKYDIERHTPRGTAGEDTYYDEDWLREQYVEKQRTQQEIADDCGVNQNTISNWLDTHDIETHNQAESDTTAYRNKQWLREQYVEKQRPEHEIATECGVSRNTIHKWIVTHKIPPQ